VVIGDGVRAGIVRSTMGLGSLVAGSRRISALAATGRRRCIPGVALSAQERRTRYGGMASMSISEVPTIRSRAWPGVSTMG
jgi:hypothetical protein